MTVQWGDDLERRNTGGNEAAGVDAAAVGEGHRHDGAAYQQLAQGQIGDGGDGGHDQRGHEGAGDAGGGSGRGDAEGAGEAGAEGEAEEAIEEAAAYKIATYALWWFNGMASQSELRQCIRDCLREGKRNEPTVDSQPNEGKASVEGMAGVPVGDDRSGLRGGL